jgi:hypothetical protein
MSDRFQIRHKTQGWTACLTWSSERAEKWLAAFDPRMYDDKTLRATDFTVVEGWDNVSCPTLGRLSGVRSAE